jgi:hypothetical protein
MIEALGFTSHVVLTTEELATTESLTHDPATQQGQQRFDSLSYQLTVV